MRVRLGGKVRQEDNRPRDPEKQNSFKVPTVLTVSPKVAMKFNLSKEWINSESSDIKNVTWPEKNENNTTSYTKPIWFVLDDPYFKQNILYILF